MNPAIALVFLIAFGILVAGFYRDIIKRYPH